MMNGEGSATPSGPASVARFALHPKQPRDRLFIVHNSDSSFFYSTETESWWNDLAYRLTAEIPHCVRNDRPARKYGVGNRE